MVCMNIKKLISFQMGFTFLALGTDSWLSPCLQALCLSHALPHLPVILMSMMWKAEVDIGSWSLQLHEDPAVCSGWGFGPWKVEHLDFLLVQSQKLSPEPLVEESWGATTQPPHIPLQRKTAGGMHMQGDVAFTILRTHCLSEGMLDLNCSLQRLLLYFFFRTLWTTACQPRHHSGAVSRQRQ